MRNPAWRRLILVAPALALIMLGLAIPRSARAEIKIGFVNSEQILEGYTGTRSAIEAFNTDVNGWNTDATSRKTELDNLGKELSSQTPMLSDDKRREKEQDYQRKLTEYDQFVQSIWGPNGLVVKRNEEILRPIIGKIQTILAKIGADEQYDLILDAANGNVLYADQAHDLTQKVLDELNKQQP
jgi:outer membrane protein